MIEGKHTGNTLDGKYRVGELLGEGGMGSVYRGEHLLIGRKVAVKFLHDSLLGNEEAVKRFYKEGQAAASIGHRNVIDILDVGVSPKGEPYLVMEYLEGEGLAELIARNGPLDLKSATAVLEQVLAALGAAHERGVVHRDLKPDNVFLERQRGGAPGIKLIDFGISKLVREGGGTALTRDGSMLGTPAYMSPEQIRNAKGVDQRADVYAAGAIFYEMLTGVPPFEGDHYAEILSNVLTHPPRDPRETRPDFPDAAWVFIECALAKDPAQRFASVDEMQEVLAELVDPGERAVSLTMLGETMLAGTFAVGDLGPAQAAGSTALAAEIFGRVVEERTGAPAWKRLARRAAAGVAVAARATPRMAVGVASRLRRWALEAVSILARLAGLVAGDARSRRRAVVSAGVLLLLGALLVGFWLGREDASGDAPPPLAAERAPGKTAKEAPAKTAKEAPKKKMEAGKLGEPGAVGAPGAEAEDGDVEKKGTSKTGGKRKRPRLPWRN